MKLNENPSVRMSIAVAIIVAIIIIVIVVSFNYTGYTPYNPDQTVSVKGESEVNVVLDVATIYFNVVTTGHSAEEAKDDNSEIIDEIIFSLLKEGFSREEITTRGFNVKEEYVYEYDDYYYKSEKEKVYKVTHTLRMQVPMGNNYLIGRAIDIGIENGAFLQRVNFELSNQKENEYKADATLLATQNAKMQAEAMAKGLGMKLGKVISVSDTNLRGYTPYMAYNALGDGAFAEADIVRAKSSVTTIQPSKQKISASVSVVYALR